MNTDEKAAARLREELLHPLTLSGTLAGLCITGVTLFHTLRTSAIATTVGDDLLAVAALLFLICTCLIFFALKTKSQAAFAKLGQVVDALFLIALTAMVVSGFITAYSIW